MTSRRIWLLCAVLAVVALFIATIIPSYFPARNVAYLNRCRNNLRTIQKAKQEWAEKDHKASTDIPTEEDLYGHDGTNGLVREPVCPAGGKYTIGAVGENPTCSLPDERHHLK
jgi:hypothetical protein